MEPTSTPGVTPSATGLRFGLLIGLLSVLISFSVNALHLDDSPLKYLTTLVLVGGIFWAQRDFKQRNAGYMSYGQGLGIGSLAAGIVGVLSAAFTYVYVSFIDPDKLARAMEKGRAELEAKGNLSEAQIDQALALSAKFTSGPILLLVVIIGSIITGLLISLITAAILKNPKPEFE